MATAFAKLIGDPFLDERSKAASRSTANRTERYETLQALAALRHPPHTLQCKIDQLGAEAIVSTGVVACRILFPRYQRARVEQRTIASRANLVDGNGLEVHENDARNALEQLRRMTIAAAEERVGIVVKAVVLAHRAISVNAMLQAVQLPAGACDLSGNRFCLLHRMINESKRGGCG